MRLNDLLDGRLRVRFLADKSHDAPGRMPERLDVHCVLVGIARVVEV
jgi:hypothetical protein